MTGECICVRLADGGPLGFDSMDPVSAHPCPVHSPEYFTPERRVEALEKRLDTLIQAVRDVQFSYGYPSRLVDPQGLLEKLYEAAGLTDE